MSAAPGTSAERFGLSPAEYDNYRQAFDLFDQNKDGLISWEELGSVKRSLGTSCTEEELRAMIKSGDRDEDGMINFEEFLGVAAHPDNVSKAMDKELRETFLFFDTDSDNFISEAEVREAMRRLGENLTDAQIRQMMTAADTDGDGRISFDEFRLLFSQIASAE